MMKIKVLVAIYAACLMAACTPQSLLAPEVASSIAVQNVTVDTTNFAGVSGRALSISNAQVRSDIERALVGRMQGRGAIGGKPVSVNVAVDRVALVSPGQSLLLGGVSGVSASVSITELATGAVVLAPTAISASGQGYAPGGILGVASRGTPESDYARTIASFADNVATKILGASSGAVNGTAPRTVREPATAGPAVGGRNALRDTAWQF